MADQTPPACPNRTPLHDHTESHESDPSNRSGYRRRRARKPSLALTIALSSLVLAVPFTASAKKGGNGGGKPGGGDGGGNPDVTINPVPQVVSPPFTYTTTELHWAGDLNGNGVADHLEPSFLGVAVLGVNSGGTTAGIVFGPAGSQPSIDEKRVAVSRLDPTTAEVTPLDTIFSTALDALNASRPQSEEAWRIAYAQRINDDGLITCRLIPASQPRRIERNEALELGIEPTPVLYAVGDLARRDAPDALMLVPISTSPNGDFLDLNEMGDVLMHDHDPVANTYLTRLFPLGANSEGTLGYHPENEVSIPELTSWGENRPSINAAKELVFRRYNPAYQLVRYSSIGGQESIMLDTASLPDNLSSFAPHGIANDGTTFAGFVESATIGKGKNRQTTLQFTPYHIISPTERTPLTDPATDGNASIPHFAWSVSNAAAPGEVEVLIQIEDTLEHQIYKPNLGARFPVPVVGQAYWATISSPVDQTVSTNWDASTGTGTYAAGFISYSLVEGFVAPAQYESIRRFVLEPQAP